MAIIKLIDQSQLLSGLGTIRTFLSLDLLLMNNSYWLLEFNLRLKMRMNRGLKGIKIKYVHLQI